MVSNACEADTNGGDEVLTSETAGSTEWTKLALDT